MRPKASIASIAKRLSRQRSTVYRENQRNRFRDGELPELDGYYGVLAQRKAAERRRRRRKLIRMPDLLAAVVDRLKAGWSPEQIAAGSASVRSSGSGHDKPACTTRFAYSLAVDRVAARKS